MRQILRRLPFKDVGGELEVHGEKVLVRPYQIIVWVSVSLPGDPPGSPIPTIIDTGHSHNFSVQEVQLVNWGGLQLDQLESLGDILVNQRLVPLKRASLWIHRNRAGSDELLSDPFLLDVTQGIAVYPERTSGAPRLPLLGLRALVRNGLRVTIDGSRMVVSLARITS